MNMNNNLYSLLKLDNYASIDKVKAMYKELVAVHHPDKGGKQEDFQRIKEAYDYLKDNENKKEYDTQLQYEEEAYEKAEEIGLDGLFQFECFQCRGVNIFDEDLIKALNNNRINIIKCEHCSVLYKIKMSICL